MQDHVVFNNCFFLHIQHARAAWDPRLRVLFAMPDTTVNIKAVPTGTYTRGGPWYKYIVCESSFLIYFHGLP
jgi:hypothetical protein